MPEKIDFAKDEYQKLVESQKSETDVFDIEFAKPKEISYEQLLELYEKIDIEAYHQQPIGQNTRMRVSFVGSFIKKEIENYIEASRQLLAYENSAQKFQDLERWQETLLKIDTKRHEAHNKIKEFILLVLQDALREAGREEEIASLKIEDNARLHFISELMIGAKIGDAHIWLTQLLLNTEVMVDYPTDARVEQYSYVSDYHDPGVTYRQAWIYYNPLKYRKEDVKYKVVKRNNSL